jgi:hypothetical protein
MLHPASSPVRCLISTMTEFLSWYKDEANPLTQSGLMLKNNDNSLEQMSNI